MSNSPALKIAHIGVGGAVSFWTGTSRKQPFTNCLGQCGIKGTKIDDELVSADGRVKGRDPTLFCCKGALRRHILLVVIAFAVVGQDIDDLAGLYPPMAATLYHALEFGF